MLLKWCLDLCTSRELPPAQPCMSLWAVSNFPKNSSQLCWVFALGMEHLWWWIQPGKGQAHPLGRVLVMCQQAEEQRSWQGWRFCVCLCVCAHVHVHIPVKIPKKSLRERNHRKKSEPQPGVITACGFQRIRWRHKRRNCTHVGPCMT